MASLGTGHLDQACNGGGTRPRRSESGPPSVRRHDRPPGELSQPEARVPAAAGNAANPARLPPRPRTATRAIPQPGAAGRSRAMTPRRRWQTGRPRSHHPDRPGCPRALAHGAMDWRPGCRGQKSGRRNPPPASGEQNQPTNYDPYGPCERLTSSKSATGQAGFARRGRVARL